MITVILNRSSGIARQGMAEDAVREALSGAGIDEIEVFTLGPQLALADTIRRRLDRVSAVVAVGGDGTVSAVAAQLAGTNTCLGVLPAGTLNHFAKDCGIPADLADAARVIAAGNSIAVDVGRLNGRVFINNSSIGIYPAMVRVRDRLMQKGWPKRLAMAAGSLAAAWQFPNLGIRLTTPSTGVVTRTPVVFIGNNSYTLTGLDLGTRSGLEDGVLQVCTARNPSRTALFVELLRALWSGGGTPEMHIEHVPEATIRTVRRRVRVALDGEVELMDTPLKYSIWPRALRVLAPPKVPVP